VSRILLIAITTVIVGACSRGSSDAGAQPAPTASLPITAGDYPAYGSAPDLSWFAGRIMRSSHLGECTYVVFSTGRGAPWGGRVAIYGDPQMIERFPDGDMVVVTADVGARPLGTCGGPGVAVKTIEEH
jgi:hypothetical protein